MKAFEIRNLSDGEIETKMEEAYEELFNLRFRLATRQLVNHREILRVKRQIAQMKTIMKEKEMGIR